MYFNTQHVTHFRSAAICVIGATLVYRIVNSWTARKRIAVLVCQKQKSRQENVARLEAELQEEGEQDERQQLAILKLDFNGLRLRLQTGDLKCVQVLRAYQAKALAVNKKINAVVEFLEDALERARLLDQMPEDQRKPLHGIPISLKEHIDIGGLETTVGIPSNIGRVAGQHAGLVKVLHQLGAVPFCRTNLPQTCISFDCGNPIFGTTLNPRNLSLSPGGSSGGEAALIAAGGSLIGFGSDLGGSTRIPAMFCGITSLKPTAGRIPLSGQGSDGGLVGVVGLYNSLGFMARSASAIEDCLRAIVSCPDIQQVAKDPRLVPIIWRDRASKPGKRLKIGWYDDDGILPCVPGCRRVVHEAVQILEKQGHEVVAFTPIKLKEVFHAYGQLMNADQASSTLKMLTNCEVDQSIGLIYKIWNIPHFLRTSCALVAKLFYAKSVAGMISSINQTPRSRQLWELNAKAVELRQEIMQHWLDNEIDVVLAPGYPIPAQPIGYPAKQLDTISYTCVYNLLNYPVGSLPVSAVSKEDLEAMQQYPGWKTDLLFKYIQDGCKQSLSMPINVQVIGLPWQEELVLKVMNLLQEKANPQLASLIQ